MNYHQNSLFCGFGYTGVVFAESHIPMIMQAGFEQLVAAVVG